jgi:hypothetical protein
VGEKGTEDAEVHVNPEAGWRRHGTESFAFPITLLDSPNSSQRGLESEAHDPALISALAPSSWMWALVSLCAPRGAGQVALTHLPSTPSIPLPWGQKDLGRLCRQASQFLTSSAGWAAQACCRKGLTCMCTASREKPHPEPRGCARQSAHEPVQPGAAHLM